MSIARYSVPIPEVPGGRTNAYLVDGLLVDPAARSSDLDRAVRERSVEAIAVTHAHPDHVGAVAHYTDQSDATIWCRAGRTERFADATGIEPDRTFREGTEITVGTATVRVLDVPGHAPDHVAFEAPGGTVVGDCAVAEGSVAVAAPEGDIRGYLTALRRVHARNPDRLFPGHGPPIDDPRATLERLIAHRLDRERRVRAAVEGGARTLDEVVDAAYEKDLASVREFARATVQAHLEKLAVERAVLWDGTLTEPAR